MNVQFAALCFVNYTDSKPRISIRLITYPPPLLDSEREITKLRHFSSCLGSRVNLLARVLALHFEALASNGHRIGRKAGWIRTEPV
jgi:hypothetical protein